MNNLDLDILVNRYNMLDKKYIPNDLIILDDNKNNFHNYINPNLKPAISYMIYPSYKELEHASMKDGYHVVVDSGYRSYNYQLKVFVDTFEKYYEEFKDKEHAYLKAYDATCMYVAYPGTSEHQTGYAFDIGAYKNSEYIEINRESPEIKWMLDNSYKYGFILRYPEGKEKITGIAYEPWHYRYVGKEISNILYNDGDYITLEEYHKELKLKR